MLQIVFAVLTLLFGLISIARPQSIAEFASFTLNGKNGIAEMRINWGGLFIALGVGGIVLNNPFAWAMLGIGYAGVFTIRLLLGLLDRELWTRNYIGAFVFELVSMIIFLLPSFQNVNG